MFKKIIKNDNFTLALKINSKIIGQDGKEAQFTAKWDKAKIRWHGFAQHLYQRSPGSSLVNCLRTRRERDGIIKTRN